MQVETFVPGSMRVEALTDKPLVPGFYPGVAPVKYHRDPCPAPSLSSSIAKVILAQSPMHGWEKHPRLNPNHEATDPKEFDLGNAAHAILFGAGKDLLVLDYPDWRKDAAKKDRDDAIAADKSPVLVHQHERAIAMTTAARNQLAQIDECEDFFERDGLHIFSEVMIVWQDEGGIWCRALIDRLCVSAEAITVFDLKTTAANAAPFEVARYQYDQDHDIQAAFYERGLQTLFSNPIADRLKVNFIVQETASPHRLTVNQIDLTLGRKKVSQAIHLWRQCTEEKRWPGYPRQILKHYPPSFMETKWLEREANDPAMRDFSTDPFLVRSGWVEQLPSREDAKMLTAG